MSHTSAQPGAPNTFIDLFAGCGGLSLGLMQAGWRGLFAIEQNPDAFKTLRHNLVVGNGAGAPRKPCFEWPQWLDAEPFELGKFIHTHRDRLESLRGGVRLVVGGPPCQGFSLAGKRTGKDPRNELFKLHLEVVRLVRPDFVLLENVRGLDAVFGAKSVEKGVKRRGRPRRSYAARIEEKLGDCDYDVQQGPVRAVNFGVPQVRPRHFIVGIRNDLFAPGEAPRFFPILDDARPGFLKGKRLPVKRPITVGDAISDLLSASAELAECTDPESPSGFKEIVYQGPVSTYQRLMRKGLNGQAPNSLRLVNHRPETVRRFEEILRTCEKGKQLSDADRERLGIRKHAITLLSPVLPSPTLTTLPDDLLHYAEPRVHTVREHARLQSFPDWFEFRGKFTTGNKARARECPRYTQVGNAVPPLLAEAIGIAIRKLLTGEVAPGA